MRHSAHQRAFITPRPLLMLANRWIDLQAYSMKGGLSFMPLALVFRRARDSSTKPLALQIPGKSDAVEVVVAPRLVFNLNLYHTAVEACEQRRSTPSVSYTRERPAAPVSYRDDSRQSWRREFVVQNSRTVAEHLAGGPNRQLLSTQRSESQPLRMDQLNQRPRLLSSTRPWDRVRTVFYTKSTHPEPTRTRTHSLVLRDHIDTPKPLESHAIGHFQCNAEDVSGTHKVQGKAATEETSKSGLTSARPFIARLAERSRRDVSGTHKAQGETATEDTSRRGLTSVRLFVAHLANRWPGIGGVLIDGTKAFQHNGLTHPVGLARLKGLPHTDRRSSQSGSEHRVTASGFTPVQTVHRESRAVPAQAPPVQNAKPAPAPQVPQVDIARLTDEVWRQFDKRIRIERQRRGRL
jgi:hypothetical protein